MLGITSTGCFFTGIIIGFIAALFVGTACIFYFNPHIKEKTMYKIEKIWGDIKTNVDSSIDAAKNAPTAEPEIPGTSGTAAPAPQGSGAQAPAPAARPKIEIKLGI